jgi:predicted transcriptional regulator
MHGDPMTEVKHTSFRIKPQIRALLEKLCEIEHRDRTNMIEVCIREYARQHGVALHDKDAVAPD